MLHTRSTLRNADVDCRIDLSFLFADEQRSINRMEKAPSTPQSHEGKSNVFLFFFSL